MKDLFVSNLAIQDHEYEAVIAKYNFTNYNRLTVFIEHLLHEHREQFQLIISEDRLVARTALQASLDAVDTAARSISMAVVVCRVSWLHLLGFLREVQKILEDFPFNGHKLFLENMSHCRI